MCRDRFKRHPMIATAAARRCPVVLCDEHRPAPAVRPLRSPSQSGPFVPPDVVPRHDAARLRARTCGERRALAARVREPVAPEFGCSSRFITHCLEQDVWDSELGRVGIDLWVTGEALAGGFRCCQTGISPYPATSSRTPFGELFEQVVSSAFTCLERHSAYWLPRNGSDPLAVAGPLPTSTVEAPATDGSRLTEAFARDLQNLQSVLESILSEETLASLLRMAETQGSRLRYPDELWVSTVYEFLLAYRQGVMRREHIVQALAPLYLGRTGSFLRQFSSARESDVEEALESLCLHFERAKPDLIQRWNHPGALH